MKSIKTAFKIFFRQKLYDFRMKLDLTQERMAELLRMAHRSYADLEHGKFCPSGLTILFFLLALTEEEVLQFLREFRAKMESAEKNGAE